MNQGNFSIKIQYFKHLQNLAQCYGNTESSNFTLHQNGGASSSTLSQADSTVNNIRQENTWIFTYKCEF